MKVRHICREGRLTIWLEGELDHHAAKRAMTEIEECVDTYLPKSCVLDLARLSFMDSSGIAVILKTYRRLGEVSGTLSVENVGKQPLRVLDAAGVDRIVRITASVKEA